MVYEGGQFWSVNGGQGQSAQHSAKACASPISRHVRSVLEDFSQSRWKWPRGTAAGKELTISTTYLQWFYWFVSIMRHCALRLLLLQLWQSRFQVTWWTTASVQHLSESCDENLNSYTAGPQMLSVLPRSEQVTFMDPMRQYPSPETKSKSGRSGWVPQDMQHSATLCNTLQHSATLCNIHKMFDGFWMFLVSAPA